MVEVVHRIARCNCQEAATRRKLPHLQTNNTHICNKLLQCCLLLLFCARFEIEQTNQIVVKNHAKSGLKESISSSEIIIIIIIIYCNLFSCKVREWIAGNGDHVIHMREKRGNEDMNVHSSVVSFLDRANNSIQPTPCQPLSIPYISCSSSTRRCECFFANS